MNRFYSKFYLNYRTDMAKLQFQLFFLLYIFHRAKGQNNPFQVLLEQTNFLLYNSSSIIEDTNTFYSSYDFIIIGSGSGGEYENESRTRFLILLKASTGSDSFTHMLLLILLYFRVVSLVQDL